ncbi:alpha/beta fold hydrolase [Kitasatospora griseola]
MADPEHAVRVPAPVRTPGRRPPGGAFLDLVDTVRTVHVPQAWTDPGELLARAPTLFRLDRALGQTTALYVATEKDTLRRQFTDWFDHLGIPVLVVTLTVCQVSLTDREVERSGTDVPAVLLAAHLELARPVTAKLLVPHPEDMDRLGTSTRLRWFGYQRPTKRASRSRRRCSSASTAARTRRSTYESTASSSSRRSSAASAAHGEELAATVPGARFTVLPTVHLANVERPAEFLDAVVAFLRERP